MDYYVDAIKKYTVFTGRTGREAFWYFVLINVLISIGLGMLSNMLGSDRNPLGTLYCLFIFLPSLAIGIRRLHDTNRSGWWTLLELVPVIGWIVLIVFFAQEGTKGKNKYGSSSTH